LFSGSVASENGDAAVAEPEGNLHHLLLIYYILRELFGAH